MKSFARNYMDIKVQAKNQKTKRYGVWQEETARFGRCWRYDIRVQNNEGVLCRRTGSGFVTKAECETAVAALRLAARENKYGVIRPSIKKCVSIDQAIEGYIRTLVADGQRNTDLSTLVEVADSFTTFEDGSNS